MERLYVLALHGGAGTIARGLGPQARQAELPYHAGLRAALSSGQAVLARGGSALDAVVAAVCALEDNPLFNAGHGAVFDADARHTLDAGVMDGSTLAAGAVAGVQRVRNPVLAARELLREGGSVLLGAEGADRFAEARGLAVVDPAYFSTPQRLAQWRRIRSQSPGATALDHDAAAQADDPLPLAPEARRMGTVGAVALDRHGHLAAATSTGGMTNKAPGRIGDTPIVGAGVYANDASCAVSCTGSGEHFIRACLAHDIHARMRYLGQAVGAAAQGAMLQSLEPLGGRGGLVALGADGSLAMPFNSQGMYRAWVREGVPQATAVFE